MQNRDGDLIASTARARARRRSLAWLAGGLAAAATVTGALITPPDGVQGQAQRLMYVHVPAAWVAYLSFALVLVASTGYLVRRDLRWDRCARAGAEIGVALTGLAIVTGGFWGQLVWGTWWAWEPRLVSTALLFLAYAGYLATRRLLSERADGRDDAEHLIARAAAVIGALSFVLVPVVHFSVVWWRSLHQPATVLAPGRPPIDLHLAVALLLSLAAFTAAAFTVLVYRLAVLQGRARDAAGASGQAPEPVEVGQR